jgi:hypothetical protein
MYTPPFFLGNGMLLRKQHVLSELQDGQETSSIKAHGINRESWKVVSYSTQRHLSGQVATESSLRSILFQVSGAITFEIWQKSCFY